MKTLFPCPPRCGCYPLILRRVISEDPGPGCIVAANDRMYLQDDLSKFEFASDWQTLVGKRTSLPDLWESGYSGDGCPVGFL